MSIHKGDDTDAFGFRFLTVVLENAEEYTITKAEVRIGVVKKVIENPQFPLRISLNNEETEQLNIWCNKCYLAVYDENGKKYTCEGTLSFKASPKVV